MQKIVLLAVTFLLFNGLCAQKKDTSMQRPHRKIEINRPGDHFMFQVSLDSWTKEPDSIGSHQSGFSRGLNMYVMLDKPFKANPNYSLGIGIGVGSSNIVFKKMNVAINSLANKLPFTPLDSSNHYKKYKLSLSYLEIPLEFRYSSDPLNPNKSWKIAAGLKIGTLINAHTKGKNLQDKNNNVINSYTEKENSKKFFNSTRFMATLRAGYGVFSLFGSLQLNTVLKDVVGPPMKLFQFGITISGL